MFNTRQLVEQICDVHRQSDCKISHDALVRYHVDFDISPNKYNTFYAKLVGLTTGINDPRHRKRMLDTAINLGTMVLAVWNKGISKFTNKAALNNSFAKKSRNPTSNLRSHLQQTLTAATKVNRRVQLQSKMKSMMGLLKKKRSERR